MLFGWEELGSDPREKSLPRFQPSSVLRERDHPAPPVPLDLEAIVPTPELEDEWIAAAHETATAAAHKLESTSFPTEVRAVLGAPASRFLDEARELEADLVVVGSRGLGAVERAVMGSVSDQLVREAPVTFVGRRTRQ